MLVRELVSTWETEHNLSKLAGMLTEVNQGLFTPMLYNDPYCWREEAWNAVNSFDEYSSSNVDSIG